MPEQTAEMTMTRAEDQLDVDAGIFRRLAVAADHVDVAAEARVGQHEMAGEQDHGRDTITIQGMPPIEPDPRVEIERRHRVGDLAAHQQRRDAGGDLHHGERHDEGRNADHRDARGR